MSPSMGYPPILSLDDYSTEYTGIGFFVNVQRDLAVKGWDLTVQAGLLFIKIHFDDDAPAVQVDEEEIEMMFFVRDAIIAAGAPKAFVSRHNPLLTAMLWAIARHLRYTLRRQEAQITKSGLDPFGHEALMLIEDNEKYANFGGLYLSRTMPPVDTDCPVRLTAIAGEDTRGNCVLR